MEIKDERKNKERAFKELRPGDIFEFDEDFFMKTEKVEFGDDEGDFYTAVNVDDGGFATFYPFELVIPVVVQLHIIRND